MSSRWHRWPATAACSTPGSAEPSIDVGPLERRRPLRHDPATLGTERGFDNAAARDRGGVGERMELRCRDALEFATIEGARACGMDGDRQPEWGKRADVIVRARRHLRDDTDEQLVGVFVYIAHPACRYGAR